jgi:uncharacterized protein with NRDE domain
MCLLFFSLNQHPTYKLILAGNRDEFYGRQTAPASFWSNHPHVVGGCDLEAIQADGTCGTWMGMSKTGRLAFITNFRDPKNINPKAPSRGKLVSDFLVGNHEPEPYLHAVQTRASQYNGFNLVVGRTSELYYLSNYQNEIKKLTSGFYGLSNHLLDTPWPKVTKGKAALEKELTQPTISIENLFSILCDEGRAPDDQLPDTGIGLDRERALSAMFIKTNGYGTRCSTVILVNKQGEVRFEERTFDLTDFSFTTRQFQFAVMP